MFRGPETLPQNSVLIHAGLQPGGKRHVVEKPFLTVSLESQGKPWKRFGYLLRRHTGLKPGVNEKDF